MYFFIFFLFYICFKYFAYLDWYTLETYGLKNKQKGWHLIFFLKKLGGWK